MLKVAQLKTLLQFGLMPHPELIKSPFCLVQLRQQPGNETRETGGDFVSQAFKYILLEIMTSDTLVNQTIGVVKYNCVV